MCKYCNKKNNISLFNYNNAKNMNVCCGQHQGVNVYSTVSMQGNVLFLDADDSYRSNSDCYYEDQGVDCPNEKAQKINVSYIKIEFCPFCGKKLESNLYEVLELEKKKSVIEKKIDKIRVKLPKMKIFCQFVLYDYPFSNTKNEKHLDLELPDINDITFVELFKFNNVKPYVYYGADCISMEIETLTKDSVIKLNARRWNTKKKLAEAFTPCYVINEDMYSELVEHGLFKKDDKKLKKLREESSKLRDDLTKLEIQLKKLDKKINKLKQ